MQIKVITASGVFEVEGVKGITLPTLDGQRTLLNKHTDAMIALGLGVGNFKVEDQREYFALSGGVASLDDNVLTLIPERFSLSKNSKLEYAGSDNEDAESKFLELMEKINEIV